MTNRPPRRRCAAAFSKHATCAVLGDQVEDRVEDQVDERELAVDARRRHVADHGVDPLGSGLRRAGEPAWPRSCRCRRRARRARRAAARSGRCRSRTRAPRRRRRAPPAGRRPGRPRPGRTCSPSARRRPPRRARRRTLRCRPVSSPTGCSLAARGALVLSSTYGAGAAPWAAVDSPAGHARGKDRRRHGVWLGDGAARSTTDRCRYEAEA